jgi:hypothetical protein
MPLPHVSAVKEKVFVPDDQAKCHTGGVEVKV